MSCKDGVCEIEFEEDYSDLKVFMTTLTERHAETTGRTMYKTLKCCEDFICYATIRDCAMLFRNMPVGQAVGLIKAIHEELCDKYKEKE